MKVYEFRKNISRYFDEALQGKAVVIERGGVRYQLVCDGIVPELSTVLPEKGVIIKTKTDAEKVVQKLDKRPLFTGYIPPGKKRSDYR